MSDKTSQLPQHGNAKLFEGSHTVPNQPKMAAVANGPNDKAFEGSHAAKKKNRTVSDRVAKRIDAYAAILSESFKSQAKAGVTEFVIPDMPAPTQNDGKTDKTVPSFQ